MIDERNKITEIFEEIGKYYENRGVAIMELHQ